MISKFRKSIRIVSIILCIAVVMCQLPYIAFAETPDYNAVLKDSIILKANFPKYLKNGNSISYMGNSEYYPQYKGDEFMVPFDVIKSVLGCSGSYDAKRETAELKKDGKTVRIRAGEDGIYYNGTAKYITNKAEKGKTGILIPLNSAAKGLGYNVVQHDDIVVVTPYEENDITTYMIREFDDMLSGDERLFTDDFENSGTWGYGTWNDGSAETSDSTNAAFYQGTKSMYIGTTQKGFIGMTTSQNFEYNRGTNYRIKLAMKKTADFKDSRLEINFWAYDETGNFLGGIPFLKIGEDELSTEWQNFTYELNEYNTRWSIKDKLAKFQISIQIHNTNNGTAAGGIYVDNFVLEKYSPQSEYVSCDFVADKFAAWYYMGDTVVYNVKDAEPLKGYNSIKSKYYNSDRELVYEQENPVQTVIENGIKYTPKDLGLYYLNLFAVASDGSERPIAISYVANMGEKAVDFYQSERTFAVVDRDVLKSMEDRSSLWMQCSGGDADVAEKCYELADLLGFSGARIGDIVWGDGWGSEGRGVENVEGVYNWTQADKLVNLARKHKMKEVLINIIETPKWAAPEKYQIDEPTDIGYIYNKVAPAPDKMPAFRDYVKALYERYSDVMTVLECWNEPHYGKTYFWVDTPENFKTMTEEAYKSLREVDPDKKVRLASASFNQAYQLFNELMEDKDYYNSFDLFTFHSRNAGDLDKYEKAYKDNGYEMKPSAATEEYLYAEYQKGVPKDHDVNCMHYLATLLNHLKVGVDFLTFFELADNIPDEVRVYCGQNNISTSHVMGLFQQFPYIEPHKGAVVAYNFMNTFGTEYTFEGEYDFGGGQKAAYVYTDNEPFVIVWNSDDKAFYLDEKLKSTFDEDTVFTDFEGKTVSPDEQLKPKKAYFIKKNNKELMDSLEKQPDSCLNNNFVRPYYNCKMPEFATVEAPSIDNLPDVPTTQSTPVKPFNEKTFAMNEGFEWTSDNWKWITQAEERPAGYDAKFAAHVDKDGLYLVVDVTDSKIYTPTDGNIMFVSDIWQCDSIQFAFDCLGTGDPDQRAEFQVGIYNGKPTLFKHVAPNVEFNMLSGWSSGNTTLSEDYVRIEQTSTGIRYKVFLPGTEMFPFQYSENSTEYLRFSLLINNNDGNGRSIMEWSSGIGDSKDPKLFGAIKFK